MKNERLLDVLEKIDEDFIAEAAPGNKPPKKSNSVVWMKWGAMTACAFLIVGVTTLYVNKYGGHAEEPETESYVVKEEAKPESTVINDVTSDTREQNVAGEGGANLETLQHMEEIKIKIDEMLPDGFIGTIEVGNDLFKAGEQVSIIAQDNVTVVQKDGSIFDYDELEPNIPDSDLAIGSSVWIGFQMYDYTEGNGKYNQIFAYHIAWRDDSQNVTDSGFPDWGLTLSVKDVSESGLTLVCTQSGGELTGELQTGSDYKLIVLKEAWEDVPTVIEDYGWNMLAYMVAKNDVTEFEYDWEWLYGKLPAGTYRMIKGFTQFREAGDYDDYAYWVEFEIK